MWGNKDQAKEPVKETLPECCGHLHRDYELATFRRTRGTNLYYIHALEVMQKVQESRCKKCGVLFRELTELDLTSSAYIIDLLDKIEILENKIKHLGKKTDKS